MHKLGNKFSSANSSSSASANFKLEPEFKFLCYWLFQIRQMQKKDTDTPFIDFGGQGAIIHFAHANGFPPEAYKQLLRPFTNHFHVIGMLQRPLWKNSNPKKFKTWHTLADDLISFLDARGLKNIIGMGHSMGGVASILAATKRPDLFSKLILIDPVVVKWSIKGLVYLLPLGMRKNNVPIAKISSKRKNNWSDKQTVFNSFRNKRVFSRFSDEALRDLVEASIVQKEDGKVWLRYSREWETQIYITAPFSFNLVKKLKMPIIAIKGESSNVITQDLWKEWQEAQAQNDFLEYPNSGHLVPMEYPQEIASWILKKLETP